MDPLSQGVLGAAASQSVVRNRTFVVSATIVGALSGMAPDLDVFIRSKTDPLLFLEFHRQFTHSLFFIPFGGLICALFFYLLYFRKKLSFKQTYLYATLGYATHGLLDACTSYGTQLFWPFSNYRVAWNNVSIIDPIFTLPLLVFILMAAFTKKPLFGRIAFIFGLVYLLFGVFQNQRAESMGRELAASRGHVMVRLTAKPTFGNLVLWKSIYETEDKFYVDAIRVGMDKKIIEGTSIAKLDAARDLPWLKTDTQHFKDVGRFAWFSDDYLALSPEDPHLVVDVRYSLVPNTITPLWGIRLHPDKQDAHIIFESLERRSINDRFKFWQMLFE